MHAIKKLLMIRDGEGAVVGMLLAVFLIIGAGMALGRGSADTLFFKRYGVEYLPVMYLLVGLAVAACSLVYAAFVDRYPAEKTYKALFITIALLLVGCWAGMRYTDTALIYPVYFLVYEAASELLIVHGALYIAQNLDTQQAKRLTPVIFAGAQMGMIVGGLLLATASHYLDVQSVLLLWIGLLVVSGILLMIWHGRVGASGYFRAPRNAGGGLGRTIHELQAGIVFTRDSSLLRYSSVALFSMVIAFYVLSYTVNKIYTESFESEASLAEFFGWLLVATNGLALALQLFVSNRVIERYGVRRINLLFPITTMLCFIGLLFHQGLVLAIIGSVNKDSLMPAFRNPVHAMFFNVLPGNMQGRARAVSVVLVIPIALLVCGGLLWGLQQWDSVLLVLILGLAAALIYLWFSRRMNSSYVDSLVSHLNQHLSLPEQQLNSFRDTSEEVIEELRLSLIHI